MKLYSYWRSSAAYRVRIALHLKGLEFDTAPVDIVTGAQHSEAYREINGQGLVPALELGDGGVITQSSAIIEWLEETHPAPPLFPETPMARASVRALVNLIACDIHPLNNLRILRYLTEDLKVTSEQQTAWYHHWIRLGFDALEPSVLALPFAMGDAPGVLDVYLIPQMRNAMRFDMDLSAYPKLRGIYDACQELPAFQAASPEVQPDA